MSFNVQVPINEYIAAARSPAQSEPANKKFFRLRGILRRRKNWFFYDTVAGASAAANLYSLIETAQSSTASTPRRICATCSHALPTRRLTASTNSYRGSSPNTSAPPSEVTISSQDVAGATLM